MNENPLVEEDGTLIPTDKLCEYSYEGIKQYIEKTSSAEELKELREWSEDVRWFCEEEFDKADRLEAFDELDIGLKDAFASKEQSFHSRKKK
ncbi:MAG: hypothetical protein ACTSQ8_24105 [Candidatus Helarchaeota archaeon]